MDLVDEEHLALLQVGQHRREVARLLDDRSGRRADGDTQLVGDDRGQRRLTQPWRAGQQHVIERLATLPRRGNRDVKILADPLLPDVLVERSRAKAGFVLDVLGDARGGHDAFVGHFINARRTLRSACSNVASDAAFNAFSIALSAAWRW